jgi:hypothetical protein
MCEELKEVYASWEGLEEGDPKPCAYSFRDVHFLTIL